MIDETLLDAEEKMETAVSVEKYGMPTPAAKITTRPFSRCRSARRGM